MLSRSRSQIQAGKNSKTKLAFLGKVYWSSYQHSRTRSIDKTHLRKIAGKNWLLALVSLSTKLLTRAYKLRTMECQGVSVSLTMANGGTTRDTAKEF